MPEDVITALVVLTDLHLRSAVSANMIQQVLDLHDEVVAMNASSTHHRRPSRVSCSACRRNGGNIGAAAAQEGISAGLLQRWEHRHSKVVVPMPFQTALATGGDVEHLDYLYRSRRCRRSGQRCAVAVVTLDETTGAAVLTIQRLRSALPLRRLVKVLAMVVKSSVSVPMLARSPVLLLRTQAFKYWHRPGIICTVDDADKLAITGHAMGGVVALITASLTDDYRRSSPLHRPVEWRIRLSEPGPALVAGLADAVGATPVTQRGSTSTSSKYHGQADPLNLWTESPIPGVLIFEFEGDTFFPNVDSTRPPDRVIHRLHGS